MLTRMFMPLTIEVHGQTDDIIDLFVVNKDMNIDDE